MSESTFESMLVATKATFVVALLATGLILALAVLALTRRTLFAARAGRVLSSLLSVGGFTLIATVSFEKVESTTPAYRRYVMTWMGPQWWDLLLSMGSIAAALGVGLLVSKLLEGKPPRGWGGTSARARDWGLLTLLATSVALLSIPDATGAHLRLFDDTIRLNLWGLWGLAIAVPVTGLLVRRLRTPPPMILSEETGLFDRYSRRLLAIYYWVVALGVPTAVVASVAANNALSD
jgi:hypothetical protein